MKYTIALITLLGLDLCSMVMVMAGEARSCPTRSDRRGLCACSRNSPGDEKLAQITLYDDINYKGFCRIIRIEPKECFALGDVRWSRRAVSIKPDEGYCFRLFFDNRCRGASLKKDAFSNYNDDLGRNFMRAQTRSVDYYDGNCTDT